MKRMKWIQKIEEFRLKYLSQDTKDENLLRQLKEMLDDE